MTTVNEYHEYAQAAMTAAHEAHDIPGTQIALQQAAVYAELAKTADEVATIQEIVADDESVTGRYASDIQIEEVLLEKGYSYNQTHSFIQHLNEAGLYIIKARQI
jgi:hypothetical protein